MIDQTHALIAHLDVEHLLETGEVKWSLLHVDLAVGREGIAAVQAAQAYHKRPKFRRPIEGAQPCTTTSPTTTATASSSTTATNPPAPTSTPGTNSSTSSSSQPETPSSSASDGTSSTPTPACSRDALRARIAELVAAGHEAAVRAAWPHGVAPLSRTGHTADDLALILTAVRKVESDLSWPFRPEDVSPTPTRKGSTWPDTTSSTDGETGRSSSSWPAQTAPSTTVEMPLSTSSPTPSSSSEMPSSTETTSDSTTESDPEDMPPASPAVTDESPPRPAPQLPDEGGDVDPKQRYVNHLDRCDTCNYDKQCIACEIGVPDGEVDGPGWHNCNCEHGAPDNGWHLRRAAYPPPPDEGGDVDPATVAALQAAFAALPDVARQAIGVISAEANAAGRPISVTQSPTLRRWSIARALVRWATPWEGGDDFGYLWRAVGLILDSSQVTDDDTTLGALIGALTIEQADLLHDTFDITVAA